MSPMPISGWLSREERGAGLSSLAPHVSGGLSPGQAVGDPSSPAPCAAMVRVGTRPAPSSSSYVEPAIARERVTLSMLVVLLSLGAVASGLLGCAFPRTIGQEAVEYNDVLARANNEVLVLNVARASMRHPIYFTGVGSLSRGISSSTGLTSTVPFGRNTTLPYGVGSSFGVSGGPTLNLGVHVARSTRTEGACIRGGRLATPRLLQSASVTSPHE